MAQTWWKAQTYLQPPITAPLPLKVDDATHLYGPVPGFDRQEQHLLEE